MKHQTVDKIKDYGNDLVDRGGEGWSAFYALADYIDTLVEDKCQSCFDLECNDRECEKSFEIQIALRVIKKELPTDMQRSTWKVSELLFLLDKESEG